MPTFTVHIFRGDNKAATASLDALDSEGVHMALASMFGARTRVGFNWKPLCEVAPSMVTVGNDRIYIDPVAA